MNPVRRLLPIAVALLAVLAVTVGCSSGSDDSGSSKGTVMVTITEKAGSISASSDLVHASAGQKIMFMVTSDRADEIHVHSEPDHEFEVEPGKQQTFTFSIDTPGTVEVESHGLDQTILKLEIS